MLVGASASVLLHINHQIMGVSGMIKGSIKSMMDRKPFAAWSVKPFFVLGLLTGGTIASFLYPSNLKIWGASYPLWRVALGGLLAGGGTSLSNGCTSGHGICGLARLSKRSLVAVTTFMTAGFLVASVTSSSSFQEYHNGYQSGDGIGWAPTFCIAAAILALGPVVRTLFSKQTEYAIGSAQVVSLLSGSAFAIALSVAAMTDASVVAGFLDLHLSRWNPALAFVMAGGLAVNLPMYQLLTRPTKVATGVCTVPTSTTVDARLVGGAIMFGSGWGLAGVCPGPAIVLLPAFNPIDGAKLWLWVLMFVAGQLAVAWYDAREAALAKVDAPNSIEGGVDATLQGDVGSLENPRGGNLDKPLNAHGQPVQLF
jgi:uncharacterized membrane protein YedE/YeeE